MLSVLAIIGDLFYGIRSILSPQGDSIQIYTFILLVGIGFSYINNIIFLIVVQHSLLKDEVFVKWKRGHVQIVKD